jgi:hypothetical protein
MQNDPFMPMEQLRQGFVAESDNDLKGRKMIQYSMTELMFKKKEESFQGSKTKVIPATNTKKLRNEFKNNNELFYATYNT